MATPFELGEIFQERYEILEKLSVGGFGQVFKARQLATGQLVAIKCLLDRDPSKRERYVARFQREMALCAQLHHPNIVRLFDSGRTANGDLFAVFEFVPGSNLSQVLAREKRLSPAETVRLMSQVLDALSCAHELGIVHRDLKPGNIMVVSTGARRNAMVLDFGIGAVVADAQGEDYAQLTDTADGLGTPGYAAPEQFRGGAPTPQTDLYSWGLVFLECLVGMRAIPGASRMEVLHNQMGPEPIAIPAVLQTHPLGALLRAVTAKDPARRQVTAAGILRELERCDISTLQERTLSLAPSAEMPAPALADGSTPASKDTTGRTRPTPRSSSRFLTDEHVSIASVGERRQVTAVCCTLGILADSGPLRDIEEHDRLLHEAQELTTEIVRRYGGSLASMLGQRVLFYFGYPEAKADDARRAALASLAIAKELSQQSQELRRERSMSINCRIGLHTGLLVALDASILGGHGLAGPAALSTTANVATALGDAAGWGEIRVSRSTYGVLRYGFRFGPVEELPLHQGAVMMEVYPLLGGTRAPASLRHDLHHDTLELVGRSEELGLLQSRWEAARRGNGQVLLIVGEAGIGKSRLARELDTVARAEPHIWLEARCMPDGQNSVLRPIIELLERFLGFHADLSADGRRERLDEFLVRLGLRLSEYIPLLGQLLSLPADMRYTAPDISPQRHKELTLGALLTVFLELAVKEPLLLIFEDLHWADPTTIELIGMLIDEVPMTDLLLVLTARPEFSLPWRSSAISQIHLGRLAPEGVQNLALRVTEGIALPAEVMHEIVQRTDGIPLFVEELTRAIVESGAVERDGTRFRLIGSIADLAIPTTLRDSLMARLDRLGSAKATAQLAAAVGREFSRALLGRISPLDDEALSAALNKLVAAELVFRRRRLSDDTYLFKHALIRDIAYESLLRPVRRRYHELIAEAFIEHFPEIRENRPELVAYHYAQAERVLDAAEYGKRAAHKALLQSANQETISHAREALKRLSTLPPGANIIELELELNGILVHGLQATRGMAAEEVKEVIERTEALLNQVPEDIHHLPALFTTHVYYYVRAQHDRALLWGERVLAMGDRLHDQRAQLLGHVMIGQVLWVIGKLEAARQHLELCLDPSGAEAQDWLFDRMGKDVRVDAMQALGMVLWALGYTDQALQRIQAAVALSRKRNHSNSVGLALAYQAGIHHYRQEADKVAQVIPEMLAFGQERGLPHVVALGAVYKSWIDHDANQCEQILAGFEAFGQRLARPYWAAMIADSYAARGDLDMALQRIEECVSLAKDINESYYLSELYRHKGLYLMRRHPTDLDAIEQCFRTAVQVAQVTGARMSELLAWTALCQLLKEQGREDPESIANLRRCYNEFTESFDTPALVQAKELLG